MEYNENEKAYILLSLLDYLSIKKEQELFSMFDNPKDIFYASRNQLEKIEKLLGEKFYAQLVQGLCGNFMNEYISHLNKQNISCITLCSENYPQKLRNLEEPPFVLFAKGDLSLLRKSSIAIVGTRTPSYYGRDITEKFTKELVLNGYVIVSGLATGVDKIAHETTLKTDGKTIAVLGGGFNHIFPSLNSNLAENISKHGLIISEYRPSLSAMSFTFPFRNRIIAGLGDAVLITEAGERSGSLHTKEYALELGRDVFAVPGNITSPKSFGTNRLIKSAQCACVTCVEDILIKLGKKPLKFNKIQHIQLDDISQNIINLLKDGEKSFDEIVKICCLDAKSTISHLTTLQISGLIKKLPANYYSL